MFSRLIPKKLYLIHNGENQPVPIEQLKKILRHRPNYCQYRNKEQLNNSDKGTLYRHIRGVQRLCRRYGVPFIVNDSFALARRINANGVHLGQREIRQLRQAIKHFGKKSGKVGVTCHDSRQLAYQACQAGASYVAFGALFQSQTKQDAGVCCWKKIRSMIATMRTDSVVIGGINYNNIKQASSLRATSMAMSAGLNTI